MGELHHLPVGLGLGRQLFEDERGVGLRATWHLDRGIVNLSIWRDDRCAETFRLPVAEVGRLIGFLADGLARATATLVEERRSG